MTGETRELYDPIDTRIKSNRNDVKQNHSWKEYNGNTFIPFYGPIFLQARTVQTQKHKLSQLKFSPLMCQLSSM